MGKQLLYSKSFTQISSPESVLRSSNFASNFSQVELIKSNLFVRKQTSTQPTSFARRETISMRRIWIHWGSKAKRRSGIGRWLFPKTGNRSCKDSNKQAKTCKNFSIFLWFWKREFFFWGGLEVLYLVTTVDGSEIRRSPPVAYETLWTIETYSQCGCFRK